jgi:hypothetical protein
MSNAFYMYEVDLVWVCRGWEVPIISYSMSPVRNPLKILQPSRVMVWYGVAPLRPPTTYKAWQTLSMYEVNLVWVCRGWEGPIISYSMSQWEPHSESYYYYPAHPFGVMVWYGVAPLRPPTTYKAWQTLSIGMKWIWYEYELDGRSQSYPTACPQWEPHSKSYVPAHPFGVMV